MEKLKGVVPFKVASAVESLPAVSVTKPTSLTKFSPTESKETSHAFYSKGSQALPSGTVIP